VAPFAEQQVAQWHVGMCVTSKLDVSHNFKAWLLFELRCGTTHEHHE
jgi:hypothetical protein